MQIYVIVVLLLYSSAVSGGLEKVLRLAQFIADIYQQVPHSCIFIINCEAKQQVGVQLHIIYRRCVFLVNNNVITEENKNDIYQDSFHQKMYSFIKHIKY